MSIRLVPGNLALAVIVLSSGCRMSSSTGELRREGQAHLAEADYASASLAFDKAAAMATDPAEKARALVGAGRASLGSGEPRAALRFFYDARRIAPEGAVSIEASRGLGEAYLRLGEYALARRYLTKGLEGARGAEREETIARLVVCARGLEDTAAATAYRSELEQPFSEEVQRILETDDAAAPALASGFDADEDLPRTQQAPRSVEPARPAPVDPTEPRIQVIPRQGWNARAPRGNLDPMGTVERITIHHSGGDTFWGTSKSDAAEEIRKIQRYHQADQGWADIGYHYIIDRGGNIWQGRRLRYQGAHARGSANHGNVGIVLLGNYLEQGIGPVQKRSLEILVAKLCKRFVIPPQRVYTHREIVHGKTDCPGPALTRCVHEIRENLRRRLTSFGS